MGNRIVLGSLLTGLLFALVTSDLARASGGIQRSVYGHLADGQQVTAYQLRNGTGVELSLITYGGIITSLKTPDKNGELANIVLSYDNLASYIADSSYFGALVGRYANRIAGAAFTINGQRYQLANNNGDNHLHGGVQGFSKRNWYALPFVTPGEVGVKLALLSPDGDQGYPGHLAVEVTYTLNKNNELIVDYSAHTDAPTHVNLTQHSYFNLAGQGSILDHQLMIAADKIIAVKPDLIPSGELLEVANSPFDFREPKPIGLHINSKHRQVEYGRGYDHSFVLNRVGVDAVPLAARVLEPNSGRVLEMYSEEPALQFYSGNFLKGVNAKGQVYGKRSGFCLEPQHFPNSPNQSEFPATLLRPGERYSTRTIYKFGVVKP